MFEPYYKIQNIAPSKRKTRENFIDDYCKANAWKKPAQYEIIADWTKNFGQTTGKFLKAPKVSMTQGVINEHKKRPKPAPGSYPITDNIAENLKKKKTVSLPHRRQNVRLYRASKVARSANSRIKAENT